MKAYAEYSFYVEQYLMGRERPIGERDFPYWAMQASLQIRRLTFGRLDSMEALPENAQMCCCEVAEKLHSFEAAKDSNGMILQSYGNDGDTGTYKADDMTEKAVNKSVAGIIRKWLSSTGLMYCGVYAHES